MAKKAAKKSENVRDEAFNSDILPETPEPQEEPNPMADREGSGKVNKSQAIREAILGNPDKSPAQVAHILTQAGIDVSPQYVSTIKSKMNAGGGGKAKAAKGKGVGASASGGSLASAIAFIKDSGGLAQARATLDDIEELTRSL